MMSDRIRPTTIRVEASSVCQLSCPLCPTHGTSRHSVVGSGFLTLASFQRLLNANSQLQRVELSNYGELFLNPELMGILRCAHERKVALTANNGVNFNTVSDEVLEGLVKYRFARMSCSLDGATQETYGKYRVGGSLSVVLDNIRRLNAFKQKYQSPLPRLCWQFVVFGHNEHEIAPAERLAGELGMEFFLKLSWDSDFSPVRDGASVREAIGATTREEYRERFGVDYKQSVCRQLWTSPQINWDGRVLGCCRNFWSEFGGNAFTDGLLTSVNSEPMHYARQMLLGKRPPRDSIPCSTCGAYLDMRAGAKWLDKQFVAPSSSRRLARYLSRSVRNSLQTAARASKGR